METQRIYWLGAALLILLSVLLYFFLQSPLRGFAPGTLIGADGIASAVSLSLTTRTLEPPSVSAGEKASLLAAVPDYTMEKFALLSRTKDGVRHIVITDSKGGKRVSVKDGTSDVPAWSSDGSSIAFSELNETGSSTNAGDPDQWLVLRAVPNGNSLVVGRGYHPHPSSGQRTIALTSTGIALISYSDAKPTVVVASPTFVPITTPFAVSEDGMRVAWVAPADHSLQVFENKNGYFVPLLLTHALEPRTMAFSPDGSYLLGTTYSGATTTVSLITVSGGKVSTVGAYPGYLKLHTWLYEK